MKKISLGSLSILTHFSLVAISLGMATLIGWHAVNKMLVAETQRNLARALPLFQSQLRMKGTPAEPVMLDQLCKQLFAETGYRFTLMDEHGKVLGDGRGNPREMRNHVGRPEFRMAMQTGYGTDRRVSESVNREMLYEAARLELENGSILVVRIATDARELRKPLQQLWRAWQGSGIILLALALILSLLVARCITLPLDRIRKGIRAFENGRFEQKIAQGNLHDLNSLADDLNHMAERLNDRIKMVERQRDEEEALFSCMIEGVVAVDHNKLILRMNQSAAQLLNVSDVKHVAGKSVLSIIRNPEWIQLLDRVLEGETPVEGFVALDGGARVLQTHGASLKGPDNKRLGALLVFNDVTELSRIETMQRDFVANVSHELKTPITSIKGFAETLLDNADAKDEDRQRFLHIILKQANRLQSIVSDILSLAALENGMRSPESTLETVQLQEILENAILPCRNAAEERNIAITTTNTIRHPVRMYGFFMEQAITNLVDNAIKYSPAGSTVCITTQERRKEISISVRDEGPGIAREHHERLWERFYRVDKGRSRQIGGTGLGLAIVRRVALLHGGRAEIESQPGQGSTFRLIFPA
jgi:two-component system, OmpR family, phosphate regulon sensor histidine kinase PhoR